MKSGLLKLSGTSLKSDVLWRRHAGANGLGLVSWELCIELSAPYHGVHLEEPEISLRTYI